jgi:hypothetical protein
MWRFSMSGKMTRRGLASDDPVDLVTLSTDGVERAVRIVRSAPGGIDRAAGT